MDTPTTKRIVAIAIGIGRAAGLPRLRGAINGARGFVGWASAMGHETYLITDDEEKVTTVRLRQQLDAALAGPPIHRLILYFAGHGLIREAEEGLWLLSDAMTELRAVAVEPLKRRLARFGIDQIAIFADACRDLPKTLAAADLTADAVLGIGPQRLGTPAIDKFMATQDGATTFMIPGADSDNDRCVFSGVLLEGLWGTRPGAFSKMIDKRITSQSLGTFLQKEVQALAARYDREVVPTWSSSFPEDDNIYFGEGVRPAAPNFPPWPEPLARAPDAKCAERAPRGPPPGQGAFGAHPAGGFGPPPPSPGYGAPANQGGGVSFPYTASTHLLGRVRTQARPASFETGAGFVVADLRRAWAPRDVSIQQHVDATWWRLCHEGKPMLDAPVPVLLELADGSVAAVTGLPSFVGALTAAAGGVAALIYREVHMPREVATSTEEAIAALEGRTHQTAALVDLAIELRQGKLVDPVRGVIGAYVYDAMGDIDSIRRMAFYYVQHGQPIPYDIALLAGLDGGPQGDTLHARVPATPRRDPRTDEEAKFDWAWSATAAVDGVVAGLWPWLRQGWAYLDEPTDVGSPLIHPVLVAVRDRLQRGRFATVDVESTAMLAAAFGLESKR